MPSEPIYMSTPAGDLTLDQRTRLEEAHKLFDTFRETADERFCVTWRDSSEERQRYMLRETDRYFFADFWDYVKFLSPDEIMAKLVEAFQICVEGATPEAPGSEASTISSEGVGGQHIEGATTSKTYNSPSKFVSPPWPRKDGRQRGGGL